MTARAERVGGYVRAGVAAVMERLDLNEAPREAAAAYRARVLELLAAADWRRYPEIDARAARAAAAALYGWSADGTLVGNGSNEVLAAAFRALLPRGGAVAALSPSFSMYPVLAARQEARLLAIRLRPPGFAAAVEEVLARAAEASLVVLCSPNNPTGGELDAALLDAVAALGAPVILDAAYAEFSRTDTIEALRRAPNLLVLRSLSKAWGLAGLRVGALLGHPPLIERVAAQVQPFATGWVVEAAYRAAAELREHGQTLVREIVGERGRLLAAVAGIAGAEAVPSAGNFFLLRRPGLTGTQLVAALAAHRLAVREIPELEDDGYVRVTVGAAAQNDLLLAALAEVGRG